MADPKLTRLEPFGCKCLYIRMTYWLPITTVCILHTTVEYQIPVSMLWSWVSMERQQFLVLHFWQTMGCLVTSFQHDCIGHFYWSKEGWTDSLPHPGNERQGWVNDHWSCDSDSQKQACLLWHIITVLAPFTDKLLATTSLISRKHER